MKRLKILFAIILLLLALPFWRFADMVAIVSPFEIGITLALTLVFAIFFAIPLKLLVEKMQVYWVLIQIAVMAILFYLSGPLSKMATTNPDFNHCGQLTYTGFFYHFKNFLTDAHKDDLEARNQLCWVRKMITKVPQNFADANEVEVYTKLVQDKLFKPEIKYRAALPLIAILYVRIYTAWGDMAGGKKVYDSLHFWITHYTEEISLREYSAWNWPHSDYIKWEYGLVEKNWQNLVDSIVVETN